MTNRKLVKMVLKRIDRTSVTAFIFHTDEINEVTYMIDLIRLNVIVFTICIHKLVIKEIFHILVQQ